MPPEDLKSLIEVIKTQTEAINTFAVSVSRLAEAIETLAVAANEDEGSVESGTYLDGKRIKN